MSESVNAVAEATSPFLQQQEETVMINVSESQQNNNVWTGPYYILNTGGVRFPVKASLK